MKKNAKQLNETMIDFKRFAIVLLAVGVFFYLGVIIPPVTATKSTIDIDVMMGTSTLFLTLSIIFFSFSKQIQKKLSELDQ